MHPIVVVSSSVQPGRVGAGGQRHLRLDRLLLDLDLRQASVEGAIVPLSVHEFSALHVLASRPNVAMTKDAIVESMPQSVDPIDPRMIDVYVGRARRKLDAAGVSWTIRTIPGRGYAVLHDNDGGLPGPVTPAMDQRSAPVPAAA